MNYRELAKLFAAFFRIGGLTFGGGLTMLPMLKHELVEKEKWITEEELLDYYAIGQSTPGIIAVNTATFVGYKEQGVFGGIVSTFGMITPSLIIITIVASFLQTIMDNIWFQYAMNGLKGVVCALMLNTVLILAKKSLVSPVCIAICITAFVLAFFTNIPSILIVVVAGICGIIIDKTGGKTA